MPVKIRTSSKLAEQERSKVVTILPWSVDMHDLLTPFVCLRAPCYLERAAGVVHTGECVVRVWRSGDVGGHCEARRHDECTLPDWDRTLSGITCCRRYARNEGRGKVLAAFPNCLRQFRKGRVVRHYTRPGMHVDRRVHGPVP